MIRFEIQYPQGKKGKSSWNRRFGLNAYYAGKSWPERKRDAEELHMIARAAMHRAGIKPGVISSPAQVRFYWADGLDIDNHAVLGKAIVDAMKGYLLADDGPKYVRKVSHEFWEGDCIRVEVEALHGAAQKG
jgi:hypothetical protein|nr:MAG TPA: crossover junction endodeoxyribonuclease [Caudoviricetes sp.]